METNTLLEAATDCLTEAKKFVYPTLPKEDRSAIEKIIAKHIRSSAVSRALADVEDQIVKYMSFAPKDGTISIHHGFTNVKESPTELKVSHNGNMGTLKNVDQNLNSLKYPTIDELKKKFPKFKESGSPDYSYGITFKKPANSEFIGKQYL
jgi:hypothetical protein